MSIAVTCRECKRSMRVKDTFAGQRAQRAAQVDAGAGTTNYEGDPGIVRNAPTAPELAGWSVPGSSLSHSAFTSILRRARATPHDPR